MSDIDQYKMVKIDEYPIKQHIDLLCFPDLYPTGELVSIIVGRVCEVKATEHKDSRYRKKPKYIFFLQIQKIIRELTSGIYNMLKNTRQ